VTSKSLVVGKWHIMFDRQAEVVAHVCDQHYRMGQSIACPDALPNGDCEHVQTTRCDCADEVPCGGCLD
jgi:hypothetical protein